VHTLTAAIPEGGLREAKKRRTRDALVRCARRLVLEHGLDAVTIHEICAAADVAPRTFFNYFESKDAAVLGLSAITLDPAFVKSFADGGPSGERRDDLARLVTEVVVTNLPSPGDLATTVELLHHEPRLIAVHVHWLEEHRGGLAELIGARFGVPASDSLAATGALAVLTLCRSVLEALEARGTEALDAETVLDHARIAVRDVTALLS
jgi:AcrR family transcriptional regulator